MLPFDIKGGHLLQELVPYVVATPNNLAHLDLQPFGVAVQPEHVIDPLRLDSAIFLDLLHKLDGAVTTARNIIVNGIIATVGHNNNAFRLIY